ncbi:MAG: hypothetical protein WC828_07790, partial [Thermoleophilia bacterium]
MRIINFKTCGLLLVQMVFVMLSVSAAGCGSESVRDDVYQEEASGDPTMKPASTESPFGMHPASTAGGARERNADSFAAASE